MQYYFSVLPKCDKCTYNFIHKLCLIYIVYSRLVKKKKKKQAELKLNLAQLVYLPVMDN